MKMVMAWAFKSLAALIILAATTTLSAAQKRSSVDSRAIEERLSEEYGIPLLNGHLILPDEAASRKGVRIQGIALRHLLKRWARLVTLSNYVQRSKTNDRTITVANLFLTKKEKRALLLQAGDSQRKARWRLKNSGQFEHFFKYKLNEFDREDFVKDILSGAMTGRFGTPIHWPIKVLNIKRVQLAEYKNGGFRIIFISPGSKTDLIGFPSTYARILVSRDERFPGSSPEVVFQGRSWKKQLVLSRTKARELVRGMTRSSKRRRRGSERLIYLGLSGALDSSGPNLIFNATNLSAYFDASLTKRIPGFDLNSLTVNTVAEKSKKQEASNRIVERRAARKKAAAKKKSSRDYMLSQTSVGLSRLDILGVKLGMVKSDAATVLKNTLGTPENRFEHLVGNAMLDRAPGSGTQIYASNGSYIKKLRALFVDPTNDTTKVIAIARSDLIDSKILTGKLYNSLVEKYGIPQSKTVSGRMWTLAWGDNRASSAALQNPKRREQCVLHLPRAFRFKSDQYRGRKLNVKSVLTTHELRNACGSILIAYIGNGYIKMLLIDTAAVLKSRRLRIKLRQHQKMLDSRKKAPSSIKF